VLGRTMRSLEETLRTLDPDEYQRAVRALLAAERVDVYAVSGSASIGVDAAAKLLRIGIRCQVFSDSHLQLMAASSLGPRSVAVGISHSGRTKDTVLALEAARRSRATTIAIANHGATHLLKHADIRLLTASFEAALPRDSLVSRISQMAVMDALYLGVLLEGYPRFRGRLARVEQILADKLYPP
jgi:RpiR family carbohydrate utilization transcriptional regulator